MTAGLEGATSACALEAYLPEGRSYSGSRNLFRDAATTMGVDLTDTEDTDWRNLLDGAALIDHLLDVEKVDIVPPLQEIAAGHFRSDLIFSSQVRFAAYLERQPADRVESIFRLLGQANELVVAQRENTKASTLVDIRVDEADILATLLGLAPLDGPDSDSRVRFNTWLKSWSRTGYLVDSFIDLRSDFEQGESGVQPTARARAVVGAAACKEGTVALRRTPPSLFGKCAINATKYVILNIKPDVAPHE